MADRSLRGIRLGAQSLQSEEGVVFHERAQHIYTCTSCGRDTTMTFAADAEVPEAWECRTCGAEALLRIGEGTATVDHSRRQGPAQPLGHAARAPHASPSSKSSSRSVSPTSAPAAAPAKTSRATRSAPDAHSFRATPVPSGAGVFASPRRLTPTDDAERDERERGSPSRAAPAPTGPRSTAGVSPVRSGTSVSMWPATSGGQSVDRRAVGGDHLAGADRREVDDRAARLDRPHPRERELLQVLVGVAEVGVVRLEHVDLGAVARARPRSRRRRSRRSRSRGRRRRRRGRRTAGSCPGVYSRWMSPIRSGASISKNQRSGTYSPIGTGMRLVVQSARRPRPRPTASTC